MAVVCSEAALDTNRTDGLLSPSQVVLRERMEEKPSEAQQTQHFLSGLHCHRTKSCRPFPASSWQAWIWAFLGYLLRKKHTELRLLEMVRLKFFFRFFPNLERILLHQWS